MLSKHDNASKGDLRDGNLREICGIYCDLLCSVVQNALWVFEFK
jgi:hypothetical protein